MVTAEAGSSSSSCLMAVVHPEAIAEGRGVEELEARQRWVGYQRLPVLGACREHAADSQQPRQPALADPHDHP